MPVIESPAPGPAGGWEAGHAKRQGAPLPFRDPLQAADSGPGSSVAGGRFYGRLGKDVIHQQLQAALALIFIHVEAVNELHGSFGRGEAVGLLDVIEGNRV